MLKITTPNNQSGFIDEISARLKQIGAISTVLMLSMDSCVTPSYDDINSTAWLLSDLADSTEKMIHEYRKSTNKAYDDEQ